MSAENPLSSNDRALLAEAVRRVEKAHHRGAIDRTTVVAAVSDALAGGRRDLFGLVKAGQRAR